MERLISVIVSVYNIKEYLPRCVESILSQTYRNLEIILVDDGSEDGSGAICDEYAAKDGRVKVIHKENAGPSGARNAGLREATGQYIGYVDGDDSIMPKMYERMLNALIAHKVPVAICRYRQVGKGAKNVPATEAVVPLSRTEALEFYICGHKQYQLVPAVWNKLYEREVLKDIRFVPKKQSEDIMYTTEVFCRMNGCVYLDTPYYNYTVDRQRSIMNDRIGQRRFDYEIPNWRKQAAYLKSEGYDLLAQKSVYYFYRRMLFYYIDFRKASQINFARRLAGMLKTERAEIKTVYRNRWVTKGDKARMRLMLLWPELYYRVVTFYDKCLVPLRQSRH